MGFTVFQILLALALVTAMPLTAQSNAKDRRTRLNRGEWSAQTISLFNTWGGLDSNPGRALTLPSPDGKKIIQVRNETVSIVIDGKGYRSRLGEKTNAELGWAPDSQRFFLTWTDGGDTGTWHTELYSVTNPGIRQIIGFEKQIRSDFEDKFVVYQCPKNLPAI